MHENHREKARKTATSKYHQRIRQSWRARSMGRTRSMPSIHMPASHQISYQYSEWAKRGHGACWYKDLDAFHNVWRFAPQKNPKTEQQLDSRGLVSVKATVLDETQSIQKCISKMITKNELPRNCLRLQPTWGKIKQRKCHGMVWFYMWLGLGW